MEHRLESATFHSPSALLQLSSFFRREFMSLSGALDFVAAYQSTSSLLGSGLPVDLTLIGPTEL